MIKTLCLVGLACAALAAPAYADDNIEFPVTTPVYPFQRSLVSRETVALPPYGHAFRVRVYSTPQHDPYYNVPPYRVIAPY